MNEEEKYKWLFDDMTDMKEKIRFKDRIEYRVSGKIHNTLGPAIIYFDNPDTKVVGTSHFFIKGLEYTEDDWNVAVRPIKLKRLKRKIDKKKENGEKG